MPKKLMPLSCLIRTEHWHCGCRKRNDDLDLRITFRGSHCFSTSVLESQFCNPILYAESGVKLCHLKSPFTPRLARKMPPHGSVVCPSFRILLTMCSQKSRVIYKSVISPPSTFQLSLTMRSQISKSVLEKLACKLVSRITA
jgi:hypothetical protein